MKPVYWCIHDRTALAEAEVEYEMHTSPSVYVRYAADQLRRPRSHLSWPRRRSGRSSGRPPPGRCLRPLAIAFHPELDYVALEQDGETYLVAEALAPAVRESLRAGYAPRSSRGIKGSLA